jgi:hypothetical protein
MCNCDRCNLEEDFMCEIHEPPVEDNGTAIFLVGFQETGKRLVKRLGPGTIQRSECKICSFSKTSDALILQARMKQLQPRR